MSCRQMLAVRSERIATASALALEQMLELYIPYPDAFCTRRKHA
jgi:hypothetical protein